MKFKRCFCFLMIIIILSLMGMSFSGCTKAEKEFSSLEDFKTSTLGTFSGSPAEVAIINDFPDAKRVYFPSLSDLIIALHSGKIDGFVLDELFYNAIAWERDDFAYVDEAISTLDYAYIFPKSEKGKILKAEVDRYILQKKESGELYDLQNKWFSSTEPEGELDTSGLTGERGTIKIATGADNKPFIYIKNNKYTGFEIELITNFARDMGYALEFTDVNWDGTLCGVEAGKYDMGAFALNPMAEREESLAFSEPTVTGDMVLITSKAKFKKEFKTLSDLEDARFGVITGASMEYVVKNRFPNAKREYFSFYSDLIIALEQGKIDAFVTELSYLSGMLWEGADLRVINEPIMQTESGFILNKSEDVNATLKAELNEYIIKRKNNGSLKILQDKWIAEKEPDSHPTYDDLVAKQGTIKVGLSTTDKPMSYMKNNKFTGFEVELITDFAREYGYDIDFYNIAFDAILSSVVSGKYDIGIAGFAKTPERLETIYFTETHSVVDTIATVLGDTTSNASFIDSLKESFNKTFIREDRWRLILDGVITTLLITIASAFFGTLLGFLIFMLCRKGNRLSNTLFKIYSAILDGTPMVVLLMILFYIVFGKSEISGTYVAIIGFTLTFAAFVAANLSNTTKGIDYGQTEAALALGYSEKRAFFKMVLPQSMESFLPVYKAELVSLVKATAIVGYITVMDLTKMTDIIRSNTYEAFFPLISTAIIYFVLTRLLAFAISRVQVKFNFFDRKKAKILKGIKTE